MSHADRLPVAALIALLPLAAAYPADPGNPPAAEPLEKPPADFEPAERVGPPQTDVPAIRGMDQPAGFASVQVNTDSNGMNIVGDAANEPSIAVNPGNRDQVAIGWRQFDDVADDFREAGNAHSTDGGATWTAPLPLEDGTFRSDPVLAADSEGRFYYSSLSFDAQSNINAQFFVSTDGGATYSGPFEAFGGDKQWFDVDDTGGVGDGHVYMAWQIFGNEFFPATFNRSTDAAVTWEPPIEVPEMPRFGTVEVGPDGALYVIGESGGDFFLIRSDNAQEPGTTPTCDQVTPVDLGGNQVTFSSLNPDGLLGQLWVAVDHSDGATRGNVYVLGSVDPPGDDPLDVMFAKSTDGGATFSDPVRVNDDPVDNGASQWFGTMSVAPNGRIDVIWNDTRNDASAETSQLFYTWSADGGESFAANQVASPAFDQSLGYPGTPPQRKLGDYYDMVSDNNGADIAYAATFNGEQDVYYLRAEPDVEVILRDGFED